jgi:hypothetical protein
VEELRTEQNQMLLFVFYSEGKKQRLWSPFVVNATLRIFLNLLL